MDFVKCCICNSGKYKNLYTIKRHEGTVNIVRCENCGHIFQNPRLSEKEINTSYNTKKEFYRSLPRETNEKGFNLRNNKRLQLIERFASKDKILDVGCAFGTFLKTAEKRGWDTYGIEISRHMAQFAKRKLKLKIFYGQIEDAKYKKESFDAITLFDVLEHVTDPCKTLKECNRILKRNGLIVIQTPAMDSIFAKLKRKNWDYFGVQHLNYFSMKDMKELLEKTGFKIVKTYYGDEIGFLDAVKSYYVNKDNKRGLSLAKVMINQFTRRIHIGNMSFGSKVYYAVKIK